MFVQCKHSIDVQSDQQMRQCLYCPNDCTVQLFCDAKREEIKAANPGAGFGETGKLLAAAWKECNAEDKANFQQQSQVGHLLSDSSHDVSFKLRMLVLKKQKQYDSFLQSARTAEHHCCKSCTHGFYSG